MDLTVRLNLLLAQYLVGPRVVAVVLGQGEVEASSSRRWEQVDHRSRKPKEAQGNHFDTGAEYYKMYLILPK